MHAIVDHKLVGVRVVNSPNYDDRPNPLDLSLIVVHGISLPPNEFGSGDVERFFVNELDPKAHPYFQEIHHLKVSSHVFINREGEVTQFVPFDKRAWHAGVSSFAGRDNCNDFSIGIELEGTDDMPYTTKQYQALADSIKGLWHIYPTLKPENIVGHQNIAPGRKTDPGQCFDWNYLQSLL